MASYNRNRGSRDNFRLTGPGSVRVSGLEYAQNTAFDSLLWLMKGPMRVASYLVLAGVALIGGGWTKGKLSNGFNNSAQNMSIARTMPEAITLPTSIAPPAIPVTPAPAVTTPAPAVKPTPPVTSAPALATPAPVVTPAPTKKSEPNLKDGPLWGMQVGPSEEIKRTLGIHSLTDMIGEITGLSKKTPQRFWTQEELVAKIEKKADVYTFPPGTIKNIFKSEAYHDRELDMYDASVQSKSGARGITQIVESTLLELLYQNKNSLPPAARQTANRIVAANTSKGITYYVPGSASEKETVLKLVEDPDIAFLLTDAYLKTEIPPFEKNYRRALEHEIGQLKQKRKKPTDRIIALEKALQDPLINIHAKCVWTLGKGGCLNFAVAMADPKQQNEKAKDFVKLSIVQRNPSLFYRYVKDKEGKVHAHPYTVKEAKEYLIKLMGTDPLPPTPFSPGETAIAKNTAPASDWQPS